MTGIDYGMMAPLLIIWIGGIFPWINTAHALRQTDTCLGATLNYTCQNSHEVIVSKSALYGRTGTGCTVLDYGKRNCSVDALSVVHRLCSGRNKCDEIIVRDNNMPRLRCTIPDDLSRNLQYSFTCVTVLRALPSLEQLPPVNMFMNQSMKSPTNSSIICATEDNPLTIKANIGQVIKITLTNFAYLNTPANCDANGAFGYVNNVYNATNPKALICKAVRESVVLTSTGDTVQLVITESDNFILTFQVLDDETPSCDHQPQVDAHSGCILQLDDGSTPCHRGAFGALGAKSAKLDWAWFLLLAIGLVVLVAITVAIFCLCRFLRNRKRNCDEKTPLKSPDVATPAGGQGDEESAIIDETPPVIYTSQDQHDGEYTNVAEKTPPTDNKKKKDTKKTVIKPPVKKQLQTTKTDTNANTDKTEPPPAVEYTQIDPKTKRIKKADISDPIPIKGAAKEPLPKMKTMPGNVPLAPPTKPMPGNAPLAPPTKPMPGNAPLAPPTKPLQGNAPPAPPIKPMPGNAPPAPPTKPLQVNAPPAPPTKPLQGNAPPAPPTKPLQGNAPPATPTKPLQGNSPPAPPTKPLQGNAPPAPPTKPLQGNAPPATPTKPLQGNAPPATPTKTLQGNAPPAPSTKPLQGNATPTPPMKPLQGNAPPAPPTKPMPGNVPPAPPTKPTPGKVPPATPTYPTPGKVPPATPTKPMQGQSLPTKPARLSVTAEEGDKKSDTPASTGAHGNGLKRSGDNRGIIHDRDGLALNET